jgi:ACT domain-containing protein
MYFIDKRVVQSRKTLVQALLELLEKKPIGKISIKELCDKSGVARTTFYRYHSTLDELLIKRLHCYRGSNKVNQYNGQSYPTDLEYS